MKEPKLQMKTLTELRLDQLETIVSSLIEENAELKERIEKLEQEKMKSTQPTTKSNKKDSCVHNDYVAYLYNTVQPRIDPFSSTNADYKKWESGMSDEVLNFNNSPIAWLLSLTMAK